MVGVVGLLSGCSPSIPFLQGDDDTETSPSASQEGTSSGVSSGTSPLTTTNAAPNIGSPSTTAAGEIADQQDGNVVVSTPNSQGWSTYTNPDYGFSFKYPALWTLREKPHQLKLNQQSLTLVIRYRRANEDDMLTYGGQVPAGDFEDRGMITFLGQEISKVVLVHRGLDKGVLYNGTEPIKAGDLVFSIRLEDLNPDYDAVVVPKVFQAEVDAILESFTFLMDGETPPQSEEAAANQPTPIQPGDQSTQASQPSQPAQPAQPAQPVQPAAGSSTESSSSPPSRPPIDVGQQQGTRVEDWAGTIHPAPPNSGFDDYFQGTSGSHFGIDSTDAAIQEQLVSLRGNPNAVHIWGTVYQGVSDINGTLIRVERLEVDDSPPPEVAGSGAPQPTPATQPPQTDSADGTLPNPDLPTTADNPQAGQQPAESGPTGDGTTETDQSWTGVVVDNPPNSRVPFHLQAQDGNHYEIQWANEDLKSQLYDYRWRGALVEVWGQYNPNSPSGPEITVQRIEQKTPRTEETRNLTRFATATVSSKLAVDKWASYDAYAAIDGKLDTGWAEGAPGPGIGEWLLLTFPSAVEVEKVSFDIGYDSEESIFFSNNRIKQATLTFSDNRSIPISFQDMRGLQAVSLEQVSGGPVETTSIKLTIDQVYEGKKYDDTCLSEFEVWGKVKVAP